LIFSDPLLPEDREVQCNRLIDAFPESSLLLSQPLCLNSLDTIDIKLNPSLLPLPSPLTPTFLPGRPRSNLAVLLPPMNLTSLPRPSHPSLLKQTFHLPLFDLARQTLHHTSKTLRLLRMAATRSLNLEDREETMKSRRKWVSSISGRSRSARRTKSRI